MKFLPKRRRAAPAIIIISLIDVLIVLLVFLMVTTNFKNTPSVALKLPETGEAPKAGASNEKPPMVVTIANSSPQFYIGNRAVTADKLLLELRNAVGADPKLKLVLRADEEASWRDVVKVMDFAKQAKIQNVRAFTRTAGSR
jgi:biopolymer transport protein ExbD